MSVKFEFNNIDEKEIIDVIEKVDLDDEENDGEELDTNKESMAMFSPKREIDAEEDDYHDYCEPYMLFNLSQQNLNVLTNLVYSIKEEEWTEERYDWHDNNGNNYEDYRYVDIIGLCEDEDDDVYELVKNLFEHVNDDNFYYDLDEDMIDIQILRYKEGGQYNWHADYGISRNAQKGMTRKLSMSIQLSDESAYEGGELEWIDYSARHVKLAKHIGAGVVFDSRLPHKANPLKSGERFALIAWASGPQLR
tara:strand:- start:43 stop:792 length:750 start_codon:yes stop_codon:yes gene_type:complete